MKILYVEDELFLAKIVMESLQTRGFEVIAEHDGAKVLTVFKATQPDVCVLDIMLPHKDGFEIAEEIRAVNKTVPILFLTAKTQPEDVVKGFRLGGNDYIRKPFSVEELIARIYNAQGNNIEKTSAHSNDIIPLGKFLFQVNRQVLQNGTEEKKLSYRESELLKILCQNRNGIIDRKDILNLLWGSDSFFNSRNLDVYITKLRGYLREDEQLEIMTIKGVGYRFVTA